MKYIETFREGEKISDIYLCRKKQSLLTKAGKPYDSIVLQDKTGSIDGKIWEPSSMGIDEFEEMDYIYVQADVTSFQNANQLNIRRVRKAKEDEYMTGDYLPTSGHDVDKMYTELLGYIKSIQAPYYKDLLESFFVREEGFKEKFQFHTAAKSVHHGFVGGLLEHTLSVVQVCDFFVKQYPILNRDLLLTAAIFHDIGKLEELSACPENDYTDEGQLLGHIVMGVQIVSKRIATIEDFPKIKERELIHCMLAHHGELEYGSPKKPALVEAVALSYADNIDAKMETLKELFSSVADNNTSWQGYNRMFESNLRKTSK